jgi:hypothetical protein
MAKVDTYQGTPFMILQFSCPGCRDHHAIPVVVVGKEKGAWRWNGDVNLPTIVPSLLVNVGGSNPSVPICHSFVTDGKIQFLQDSTHELAGQTVEIPNWSSES